MSAPILARQFWRTNTGAPLSRPALLYGLRAFALPAVRLYNNSKLSNAPPALLAVPAHSTTVVHLNLLVPEGAVPNVAGILRLSVMNAADTSILAEASVLTIVGDLDLQEPMRMIYLPVQMR